MNQAVRVRRDAQQHVFEIHEGRDVDEFAALNERIEKRRTASAVEATGKQPIFATDRDDAQLMILGSIVIDGHTAILDEALQGAPRRDARNEATATTAEGGLTRVVCYSDEPRSSWSVLDAPYRAEQPVSNWTRSGSTHDRRAATENKCSSE